MPAANPQMLRLTIPQLLAEVDKVAAAGIKLQSWEARCRVTSQWGRDPLQPPRNMGAAAKAPKHIAKTHSTLLVSSGKQWLSERRLGEWQDENIEYRRLCDGENVQEVFPSDRSVILWTRSEYAIRRAAPANGPELPVGFPPFLETRRGHRYSISKSLPDVRTILANPDAKVLPWRTRVNGRVCYVVERTTTIESPVFHSVQDADTWRKKHPDRPLYTVINRWANPSDMRIDKQTVRLALDPQSGFMPVRYVTGQEIVVPAFEPKDGTPAMPRFDFIQFPKEEVTCADFRQFADQGYIAGRFEYARYSTDRPGNQEIVARKEVVLERFQVNRQYPSDSFHFDPPKGYRVGDSIRGIWYSVGDSEEKIAALLTAAKAKKAFYEELKKKSVPPLEGALWLNSEPIRLADARGKRIRLHFWSIGCWPCVAELPRLQQQWERDFRQNADSAFFVSIHPYVDGDGLQQLKDLLRKKHITFPVMVDSRAPDGKAWGKTSAYYRVYSEPSDVWIDDKGYFARLAPEGWVSEGNWWMKKASHPD